MRALAVLEPLLRSGLPRRVRDALAVGVVLAAAVLSLSTLRSWSVDDGLTFRIEPDRMVVADVSPWGAAADSGLRPGMVVLRLNEDQISSIAGDPEQPTLTRAEWPALTQEAFSYVEVLPAATYDHAIATGEDPPRSAVLGYVSARGTFTDSWPVLVFGLTLLVVIWWWLLGRRDALRPLAPSAAAAATTPLILVPYALTWGHSTLLALAVILPFAVLPLADGLTSLLPVEQRPFRAGFLLAALVALGTGLILVQSGAARASTLACAGLAAVVLLVPAIGLYRSAVDATRGSALVTPLELAALAFTPVFALAVLGFREPGLPWLLGFWLILLVAAQRFTVGPLIRLVGRTRLQRDLVVAATEAERSRIATDLHDVALQDLDMLAMRLDAAGDVTTATSIRGVADRVREICGDLRLPLLDDLGVGPALEWLVERLDQATPGGITLERTDGGRLPAEVELAIFRVAQEALANAVRHGQPPISVRYAASADRASLVIDDAGPGIAPGAAEVAQRTGRFGLLNMQQRAEQVGALLDVRRWPTGGTHVTFEWRSP